MTTITKFPLKPIIYGFEDVDDSPTKEIMLRNRKRWPELSHKIFSKCGGQQLYDIQAFGDRESGENRP